MPRGADAAATAERLISRENAVRSAFVDTQRVLVEIEAGTGEAGALALPHPGTGGEDDKGAVAVGHRVDECVDGRGAQRPDLDGDLLGLLRALAR